MNAMPPHPGPVPNPGERFAPGQQVPPAPGRAPGPVPGPERFAPGTPGEPRRPGGPGPGQGHPGAASGAEVPPAAAPALEEIDETLVARFDAVRREVAKVVVGQESTVSGLLTALLCGGHVLLEGVPGVAKTLLVKSLAAGLELDSHRVQFTPDLMPGDVTGSMIYNSRSGEFEFRAGPVFTNLLVADEINRTPPKTQSALLEAMEERQVSTDGTTRPLPDPFLVAATQNPVEYEGTYPLPEAQLDRFLFKLVMPLPDRRAEVEILRRHAHGFSPQRLGDAGITPAATAEDLRAARLRAARVHVSEEILGYVADLSHATRVAPSLSLGVSPRGGTKLVAAAQATAWLARRTFVTPDDVKALVPITFRHRLLLKPEAQMDGITVDQVLTSVVETTRVPR